MTIKQIVTMESDKINPTPGWGGASGVDGGYIYRADSVLAGELSPPPECSSEWPHGKIESTKLAVCRACGGVGFQRRGRMEIMCRQCEGTGRVRVFTIVAPYRPGKES